MSGAALLERDIRRLAEQEARLRFERFDRDTAWELGCRIRALCQSRGVALAIEVPFGSVTVSGVPQREDHALVVEALDGLCGVPLSDVKLDAACQCHSCNHLDSYPRAGCRKALPFAH